MWPSTKLLDLLGITLPIISAPMAGVATVELAAAVSGAGGLGSLGASASTPDALRRDLTRFRAITDKPININFFCHDDIVADETVHRSWHERLRPFRTALGLNSDTMPQPIRRPPFNDAMCQVVEELRPAVVSFHFGLPPADLLGRVKAAGCQVLCSATTAREARHLAAGGADAIIAQGNEAGGHRGMFLTQDTASQPGTMALVPQVVDAVEVPVIAAGGIGDARGIAAAFLLGAAAVQMGTAFLFCPEAAVSPLHRAALNGPDADETVLTNVFTGRPARTMINRFVREVGPMADDAPVFPTATSHIVPLRERAEAQGSADFTALWAGQAAKLGHAEPAAALTRRLATDAAECLRQAAKAAFSD